MAGVQELQNGPATSNFPIAIPPSLRDSVVNPGLSFHGPSGRKPDPSHIPATFKVGLSRSSSSRKGC